MIGHSRQGRPIVARELGDPAASRTVLVVGSIHGDETQGQRVVRAAAPRTRGACGGVELWTIETVNPDGVAAGTRGNARSRRPQPQLRRRLEADPAVERLLLGPEAVLRARDAGGAALPAPPPTRCDHLVPPAVRPHADPVRRRGRRVALRYARLSGLPARDCYPTPPGAATGWQDEALREKAFVAEFGPGSLSRGAGPPPRAGGARDRGPVSALRGVHGRLAARRAAFVAVAFAFAVTMMGTTLPTPLYPLYQEKIGFSELMVTIVFAVYALAVIAGLLLFGAASDQLGRRRALLPGLALSAASAVAFLLVGGLGELFVGPDSARRSPPGCSRAPRPRR